MKLLKYRQFNESKQDIDSICEKYGIENYTINEDGSIDVDGEVNLYDIGLTELPLKFRNVSGSFYCDKNKLSSLEGSPRSVGGNFYCDRNKLTSLKGGPQSVDGLFSCKHNELTYLEGSPSSVYGNFLCSFNELTQLKGGPNRVDGDFEFSYNKLTSFKDAPQSVGGNFWCSNNPDLISFEGFPLHYDYSKSFTCYNTKLREIYRLFDTIEAIEWINEFEVVNYDTDVPEVYYIKLEDVWDEIGQEPIPREEIKLKSYKLI